MLRERYSHKDLFDEVKIHILLEGGTLSVDDSVIDKFYSDPKTTELVGYFWSGKHKRPVKGINLISLYYTDSLGVSVPVNFRINDKKDGKTKNDYFREMTMEVLTWGIKPSWVTGDSWYASMKNLKFLKKQEQNFLFGIAKNRLVSLNGGPLGQVRYLEIPESGLLLHLKGFGMVKVFRKVFKKEYRYYIMFAPELEDLKAIDWDKFKQIHDLHWGIETYHRALKQVCNIERFQVRDTNAIRTHIFSALRAFVLLELQRAQGLISNWYEPRRNLFNHVISSFIQDHLAQKNII